MDELAGGAGGGDEVEPAAADEGVFVQAEDAVGDGVAMVVVVKEPAVQVLTAQRGLQGVQVHGSMVAFTSYLDYQFHRPMFHRSTFYRSTGLNR